MPQLGAPADHAPPESCRARGGARAGAPSAADSFHCTGTPGGQEEILVFATTFLYATGTPTSLVSL
jgi:hypothetical protein